jgi:hypothetical protein
MRVRRFALASIAAAAVLVSACATMRIGSYVERGTDFSKYHTYTWGPADALPIGDPRLDNNPIFRDYLQGAVERGLHQHNLLLVPDSATPDLLVHFHGSVRQIFDVAAADRDHGVEVDQEVTVIDYDEGTLIIDIVDARTNRLVWRGWAIDSLSGILDSQDRMEKTLELAVTKMLVGFKGL